MRFRALLFSVAFVISACSANVVPTPAAPTSPAGGYPGWPPNVASDLIPYPVSTEIVVGPNRFLVNLIDQQNNALASASLPVTFNFYNLAANPSTSQMSEQAIYLPTVQGRPGIYRTNVSFDAAGDWGIEAVASEPDGTKRTGRVVFEVQQTGTTPAIGAQAPSTPTPTATTAAQIATISSDSSPDPDFYQVSESDALAQHKPFVIIFATPAFCQTATCGPTLDVVKSVAANFKDQLTFIHVEPYELQVVNGQLQPVLSEDNLPIPVAATNTWGLQTEPFTFVVDSSGKITAKFEGIASADELQAAFAADLTS